MAFSSSEYYKSPSQSTWSGRQSQGNEYIHEKVQCLLLDDLAKAKYLQSYAILGYACDDGVRRNKGRVGAVDGPESIKKQFGKLASPLGPALTLSDVGDVICVGSKLEETAEVLAKAVESILRLNHKPILLGGGHDIAWGHYRGIRSALGSDASIGIINIDAHFDLRPPKSNMHSGSPFYQILSDDNNKDKVSYLCLGINEASNPQSLFNQAALSRVQFMTNIQCQDARKVNQCINSFVSQVEHIYLTIDLDSIAAAYAPGVSAPAAIGFTPFQVIQMIEVIKKLGNLISVDIAEMNPRFDIDDRTSKLAAQMLWRLL